MMTSKVTRFNRNSHRNCKKNRRKNEKILQEHCYLKKKTLTKRLTAFRNLVVKVKDKQL